MHAGREILRSAQNDEVHKKSEYGVHKKTSPSETASDRNRTISRRKDELRRGPEARRQTYVLSSCTMVGATSSGMNHAKGKPVTKFVWAYDTGRTVVPLQYAIEQQNADRKYVSPSFHCRGVQGANVVQR